MSKLNAPMRNIRPFLLIMSVLTFLPLAFAIGGGSGGGSGSSGGGSSSGSSTPWVAEDGRLYYDGKQYASITNRWSSTDGLDRQRRNGLESYETDFVHYWGYNRGKSYPRLFYGCTSYADTMWDRGYDDCSTAGVDEAAETMGFGFGTYDIRDIKAGVYYRGKIHLHIQAGTRLGSGSRFLASLTQQSLHCRSRSPWRCGLFNSEKETRITISLNDMNRGDGYLTTGRSTTVRW